MDIEKKLLEDYRVYLVKTTIAELLRSADKGKIMYREKLDFLIKTLLISIKPRVNENKKTPSYLLENHQ